MIGGLVFVLSAYLLWAMFPLYFKALDCVSALEILSHRIVWSLVFAVIVLFFMRRWHWIRQLFLAPKILLYFAASSVLIAVNWGTYIYAVLSGVVIDASFGYFINPLVTVLLGAVCLREKLRPTQWVCVGIAAAAVLFLTITRGNLPLISLVLAVSFGLYGLVRKVAPLGSLEGFSLESAMLFPFALGYLVYLAATGEMVFLNHSASIDWLLLAAGPITAVPLLLFASGARRIPYSILGITQYSSPTIQFFMAIYVFNEPLSMTQLFAFGLIWIAVALFTAESILWYRKLKKTQIVKAS